jgi:xanthosine utilization system XapX-like protein
MKAIKVLGHPIIIMSIFLLLLIEGDNFGGFYLLYLILALPYGAPYAIVALLGLIVVFIGYKIFRVRLHPMKPILYLIGQTLMFCSLIMFFSKGNKYATFQQIIPLFSFVLFALCSICLLINSFILLKQQRNSNDQKLNIAT